MGLPSIFEVFQLAIGPSTVLTTGALRIGQAFREVLLSSPYRTNYRILIELSGLFSKYGRVNNSDQAVVAGLGGFTLEESGIFLKAYYEKIRETGSFSFLGEAWPFNPESDLVFKEALDAGDQTNSIRFLLISNSGQPIFQAEYFSIGNGLIKGTGIKDRVNLVRENSPESFQEIKKILTAERISLLEYAITGECHTHRITAEHFRKRMLVTWKLMMSNIDRGLKGSGTSDDRSRSFASTANLKYMTHLEVNPTASGDQMRAAINAVALSEQIINNHPVITAPTCKGSAIVPAVMRLVQEKFMISDEKLVDGLTISGLFGTLILHQLNESKQLSGMHTEIACSAIMASAGVSYLMGGSLPDIEKAATLAALFYGNNNETDSNFEPKSFILMNSMVAQTLLPLFDLSRVQPEELIPEFDEAVNCYFSGKESIRLTTRPS